MESEIHISNFDEYQENINISTGPLSFLLFQNSESKNRQDIIISNALLLVVC